MTRSNILATRPVDDFLTLLRACRRDLAALRAVLANLHTGCTADREPATNQDQDHVRQFLERLAPVVGPGCCPVCTQPVSTSTRWPRTYCTQWCSRRAPHLRRKGLLPGGPACCSPSGTSSAWSPRRRENCEPHAAFAQVDTLCSKAVRV
ncbi:hypothetical protein [Streptomyces atratus]